MRLRPRKALPGLFPLLGERCREEIGFRASRASVQRRGHAMVRQTRLQFCLGENGETVIERIGQGW